MAINVAEITSVLKKEIAGFEQRLQMSEVGTVLEVGDGIARIYGLSSAMAGELLEFGNGVMGQVFNLEEDSIGAVIFGNPLAIKEVQGFLDLSAAKGAQVNLKDLCARFESRP